MNRGGFPPCVCAGSIYHEAVREAVYGWKYRMVSAQSLNRKSERRVVAGFLLKAHGGYGCVQPWEEFGHAAIEQQWAALCAGQETPLLNAALHCARADGSARLAGKSWWSDRAVPVSHATITAADSQWPAAVKAGFTTVKLKSSLGDRSEIVAWMERYPSMRVRLDFNETADPPSLLAWLQAMPLDCLQRIDFLEDPFPFDRSEWLHFSAATGVSLAQDRSFGTDEIDAVFTGVWKPAWSEIPSTRPQRLVVTSAMDHPVGQAWAAFQAAEISCEALCGLRTDHLFERDDFTQLMGPWLPQWPQLAGTGLGFDDLLENIPWTRLR